MLLSFMKYVKNPNTLNNSLFSILIVGLGNPGHSWTRHNIGADMLWEIIEKKNKKKIDKDLYLVFFDGFCAMVYLCPDIMNISGQNIQKIYNKYSCKNMIVCVDDLDTKPYHIKSTFAVSSGGHNGVKSIINSFGHNRFWKIKIGIGRSDIDVSEFVLSSFNSEEKSKFISLCPDLDKEIHHIIFENNLNI